MSRSIFAAAAALAAFLAACDTSVGGGGAADAAPAAPDASPACAEATAHSDLAWIQDNIFTPSCAAFSACHMGSAAQAAGLNLEAGMAQAELVDQVAVSQGLEGMNLVLVVPGDSNASYLMTIIDHESKGGRRSGPLPTAGTMPFNSPLMCVEKRDAIARWIDSL